MLSPGSLAKPPPKSAGYRHFFGMKTELNPNKIGIAKLKKWIRPHQPQQSGAAFVANAFVANVNLSQWRAALYSLQYKLIERTLK